MDLRKVRIVARFELLEAVRSRLFVFVIGLYAVGSALGAWAFIRALEAAEDAARTALAEAMGTTPDSLPPDLVREKALPRIAEALESDRVRDVLLSMDPLAIFYGFLALQLVSGIVLMISAGAHAADLESGAARYALFRVDRASWALGKTVGHAGVLAAGLGVGALVTGLTGLWVGGDVAPSTFASLGRASVSAWLYGLAYLGLFGGVSVLSGTPLRARGLSFVLLFVCWLGHAIVTSDAAAASVPGLSAARWLFPPEYEAGLWLTDVSSFVVSALGLVAIGGAGLALGVALFQRRDA